MDLENKMGVFGKKKIEITVLAFVVIISLFLVVKIAKDLKSYEYIGKDNLSRNSITVDGKGEMMVKPDLATLSFSVTEEKMDISKATDAVNAKIGGIINNLKSNGVEEKDIKTTSYSINPRYDYISAQVYPYNSGKRVLAGYEVSQSVTIKIRDLAKAGKIIADLGGYGVTDMSGLSFTNDKYDDLVKQVRSDAINQAKEEAKKLSKELGVKLGDIINFSDGRGYSNYYDSAYPTAVMSKAMGGEAAVIPTGENKIVSNVSITYEIK